MFKHDHHFNLIHQSVTRDPSSTVGHHNIIEENVIIGKNVTITDYVKIKAGTVIEDDVVLGAYVRTGGNHVIGKGTVVKCRATISPEVEIGKNCFIGPHALLLHATPNGTHSPCKIEDGAYIGSHSTILPGVIVGGDAVVGSGAVVTKYVAAKTMVLGVPARPRK
jgi:acetyltransferase-like isoleucine patch superfamily enzyme